MSEQRTIATIPTAMQQRLQWKPVKGALFRKKLHFVGLFDVYCFATGKRYKRGRVVDKDRETKFVCLQCGRGYVRLHILRRNSTLFWWSVKTVETCNCGTPPALLHYVEADDLTSLVGRCLRPRSDWKYLAAASFPGGYVRVRLSQRLWRISCKRENCDGEIVLEAPYLKGSYNVLATIVSAVGCSKFCQTIGNEETPVSVKNSQQDDRNCPLCYQEQPNEWIKFPCGQKTCLACFTKCVLSCPLTILKSNNGGGNVVQFEPSHDRSHFYSCPFCKAPYFPWTNVSHHVQQHDSYTARKVEVRNLVPTPVAYQSFDDTIRAHISTEAEYRTVLDRYVAYLHRRRDESVRQSQIDAQRGGVGSSELYGILDAVTNENYGRLQALRQSGLFRRHQHPVLNFMEAVEDLHVRGMDGGFLRRVAGENNEEERHNLMQSAYEVGWEGHHPINSQLIINLLQRNALLEVIDLVSDDDSYDGAPIFDSDESDAETDH